MPSVNTIAKLTLDVVDTSPKGLVRHSMMNCRFGATPVVLVKVPQSVHPETVELKSSQSGNSVGVAPNAAGSMVLLKALEAVAFMVNAPLVLALSEVTVVP